MTEAGTVNPDQEYQATALRLHQDIRDRVQSDQDVSGVLPDEYKHRYELGYDEESDESTFTIASSGAEGDFLTSYHIKPGEKVRKSGFADRQMGPFTGATYYLLKPPSEEFVEDMEDYELWTLAPQVHLEELQHVSTLVSSPIANASLVEKIELLDRY